MITNSASVAATSHAFLATERKAVGAALATPPAREIPGRASGAHNHRARWLLSVLVFAGWITYALAVAARLHARGGTSAPPFAWAPALIGGALDAVLWVPAAALAVLLAHRIPLGGSRTTSSVATRIGAHVTAMLCAIAWRHATTTLLVGAGRPPVDATALAGSLDGLLADAVLYALLTGMAHAFHYALRTRDLEAALRNERLTVLSMELRPHFLLNALNTAAELVHRDSHAADQLLTAVGQLLSHSLRDGRRHVVPLARELELLQHYYDVERARFADRLTVELAVASDALAVSVPPFILQLLVENSVRHGIAPGALRGTVRIVAMRDGAMLRLDVTDDGVGFGRVSEESRGGGVGIANVRARLHEIYGTRQSVEITSHVGRGTTVAIRLPWRRYEGA